MLQIRTWPLFPKRKSLYFYLGVILKLRRQLCLPDVVKLLQLWPKGKSGRRKNICSCHVTQIQLLFCKNATFCLRHAISINLFISREILDIKQTENIYINILSLDFFQNLAKDMFTLRVKVQFRVQKYIS
jgi:NAD-dependent DNA ligase